MEPFLVQNTVPLTSFCLVVSACSLIHSFKIGVLSVFPWLSQNFADGCLTVEIACYVSDIQLLLSGVFMYTSVIYQLFPACLIAHKSPLSWHVSVLSSVKGQIFLTFLFPIWFLKRSIGIFASWLCCKSSFPFFSQLDTLRSRLLKVYSGEFSVSLICLDSCLRVRENSPSNHADMTLRKEWRSKG